VPAIVLPGALPLVCWTWIIVMARDMYGPMTGASAWMMTPRSDIPPLLLLWAMWAVMMTDMMLPAASPDVGPCVAVLDVDDDRVHVADEIPGISDPDHLRPGHVISGR
jgi:hypothetical protein